MGNKCNGLEDSSKANEEEVVSGGFGYSCGQKCQIICTRGQHICKDNLDNCGCLELYLNEDPIDYSRPQQQHISGEEQLQDRDLARARQIYIDTVSPRFLDSTRHISGQIEQ